MGLFAYQFLVYRLSYQSFVLSLVLFLKRNQSSGRAILYETELSVKFTYL